eukprot:m.73182 g.73182  ORF g.73182 m.73182 type:complete len:103 (-) comp17011_c0_seq1:73-381(-)
MRVVLDDMEDTIQKKLGAWPFRTYIACDGKVDFQGMPEEYTYSLPKLVERLTQLTGCRMQDSLTCEQVAACAGPVCGRAPGGKKDSGEEGKEMEEEHSRQVV